MGWGCGIPEPLRMCSGLPGHIPYAPPYVEPPLGERRGLPGLLAHGCGIPGPPHGDKRGGPRQGGCPEKPKTTIHS